MLAIISDTHDNLVNLDKILSYCREHGIKHLAHAGDLTNAETLDYLANNFPGHIWLVSGNCNLFEDKLTDKYDNITFLGRRGGVFDYQGLKIGLCHEPRLIENLLNEHPELDFIFYGHTHKPWESQVDSTRLINPGNAAGTRYEATFAAYEPKTDDLRLIRINEL